MQLRKESLKKIQASIRDSNRWPLRYRCSALPIKLTSQLGAGHWIGSLKTRERMMMKLWIYESELRSEELFEGRSSKLYPVQAWILSGFLFATAKGANITPSNNSSLCSSHIWFSYIYNFIVYSLHTNIINTRTMHHVAINTSKAEADLQITNSYSQWNLDHCRT